MTPDTFLARAGELLTQGLQVFGHGDVFDLLFGGLVLYFVGRGVSLRVKECRWPDIAGIVAFVAWFARDIALHGLQYSQQFFATGIRGLVVMLYVRSAVAILLAILPLHRFWDWLTSVPGRIRWSITSASRRRQQRQAERRARPRSLTAKEQAERERRQQRERAERDRREQTARQDQAIRDQTRFELQLLYDRNRPAIRPVFSPGQFKAYLVDRLPDSLAPNSFERRAEQLRAVITAFAGNEDERTVTIEEVVADHKKRVEALRSMGLDEDVLDTLLPVLDAQRNSSLQNALRHMKLESET